MGRIAWIAVVAGMLAFGADGSFADGPDGKSSGESPNEKAIKELQGRWERDAKLPNGALLHIEKEVVGQSEIVRTFDGERRLVEAHQVDFDVEITAGHRLFLWKNGSVIDGPNKGQPMRDGRYAYSVKNGRWFCVHGLEQGDPRPLAVEVWTRVENPVRKEKPDAP